MRILPVKLHEGVENQMLQGVCSIDTGLSAMLKTGSTYYLQAHGNNNYYVSNFENPKSYFGSFSKKYFRLINQPKQSLRRFVARVSRSYTWYTIGDEYIITENDHNGYFHVYLKKRPNRGPIGSYLSNFFEIIEPFNEEERVEVSKVSQTDILEVEKSKSKTASEPEPQKKSKECDQLSLFDFMDS